MGHQKKRPMLEPVLENYTVEQAHTLFTRQPSAQYKPHKYGAPLNLKPQCRCLGLGVRVLSFLGKLRDRYIKAMNEMAMGADFTAVTGYCYATDDGARLQNSPSAKDRELSELEAMEEKSAAITRSKSQARQLR